MRDLKLLIWPVALLASATMLHAQQTNDVDALKQQLRDATSNFDKVIQEQRQIIDSLKNRLDTMEKQQATAAEKEKLTKELAAETSITNAPPASWSPSQPLTVARAGSAYMNVSFDVLMDAGFSTTNDPANQLLLGDHDPKKRGFSLPNAEISLDGAVDPYFKGYGNIVFKLDKNNETEVELEEAYLVSSSLPANLQLKGGQFFSNFGRQNSQHPHSWSFVDQPIILTRAFGPDGLRSLGAQMSWLVPTPFYTEVFLGVMDGQGGTSFNFRNTGDPDALGVSRFRGRATTDRSMNGLGDLLYVPRLASSFDLSDTQTLVVGASGAFGPNDTGPHSRTEVYGADVYWKWKPANASQGFPFVAWQSEALYSRFGAGADPTATPIPLPSENLRDWGFYTQVLWGFKERWVAGLRGEYANGNTAVDDPNDAFRGERTRISPNITFFPSEFSKIRLQYNYDHGEFIGNQHSIWLQVEFLLGAHGAHKF